MKDFKPRPTEYRGVTYRSKCEAMFALWLELRNSSDTIIDYEPDWAEIGDYVPDFAVHSPLVITNDGSPISVFRTSVELIEYKPCRPTFTYIKEVSKKLFEISNTKLRENKDVDYVGMTLYWGSVYDIDRGRVTMIGESLTFSSVDWMAGHERAIREHRFDLQQVSQ